MVRKIVPGGPEPNPQITARLPYKTYLVVRELAIKHDVTIGEAFELLLHKVQIETEEKWKENYEKLKEEHDRAKRELDACKKELEALSEIFGDESEDRAKRSGAKAKRSGAKAKRSRTKAG